MMTGRWFSGRCGAVRWEAKVYAEPSVFGLDGGTVSKLYVQEVETGRTLYAYDRGLDVDEIEPFGLVTCLEAAEEAGRWYYGV